MRKLLAKLQFVGIVIALPILWLICALCVLGAALNEWRKEWLARLYS